MTRTRTLPSASFLLLGALGLSCNGADPAKPQPTTVTETGSDPRVLPIDTSLYFPEDTAPDVAPNLTPANYVIMNQVGNWTLSPTSAPYADVAGALTITEYVDVLDTALPVYECNVTYSLTGTVVNGSTCAECAFVFDVEYYVTAGDPSTCHDPDAPPSGVTWQLGYRPDLQKLMLNYYGTDVWLPWYDATEAGGLVSFQWAATLAIELPDTGMDQ